MNISKSDLKFIKDYHKEKTSYEKEQELVADEFDVQKRQAPLRIFNKINKEKKTNHKYSWKEHKNRMYDILPPIKVIELEGTVRNINTFENPLWKIECV